MEQNIFNLTVLTKSLLALKDQPHFLEKQQFSEHCSSLLYAVQTHLISTVRGSMMKLFHLDGRLWALLPQETGISLQHWEITWLVLLKESLFLETLQRATERGQHMLKYYIVLILQLWSVYWLLSKLQTHMGFPYCTFKDSKIFTPWGISGTCVPLSAFYLLGIWSSVISGTHFQKPNSMLIVFCFIPSVHNRKLKHDEGFLLPRMTEMGDLGLARGWGLCSFCSVSFYVRQSHCLKYLLTLQTSWSYPNKRKKVRWGGINMK